MKEEISPNVDTEPGAEILILEMSVNAIVLNLS